MSSEWRAHIAAEGPAFALDCSRLFLYRLRFDNRVEVVTSFDANGVAVVYTDEPGVQSPFRGFLVPNGALAAIAEQLKPGPSQGEVRRLEDALGIERGRVDRLLGVITGGAS